MATALVITNDSTNFFELALNAARFRSFETRTSSVYRITGANGDWIEARGTGFQWSGSGSPVAGTVLSVTVGSGDRGEVEVSRLSMSLKAFRDADVVRLMDSFGATTFVGGTGNDQWHSFNFDTVFYGLGGTDTFQGGRGNDTVHGGPGLDALSGGEGNDFLDGGPDNDHVNGGRGIDDLRGGTGNDTLDGFLENDTLYGQDGDDVLFGNEGADYLNGGPGSDTASYRTATSGVTVNLANRSANTGEAAGDSYNSVENLRGSYHADSLTGNVNQNTIDGWEGNDVLTGNGGADTFAFTSAIDFSPNIDTITDFSADDTISLENRVFAALTVPGALPVSAFKNLALAAPDADDRIFYNPATGNLAYDPDGSGGLFAAVRFAHLANLSVLTAEDFLVV